MTEDAVRSKSRIEPLLRAWGHYYGERPPREWDEHGDDLAPIPPGPLARAIDYSGGDLAPYRSARGMRRLRGVPSSWGFDPLKSKETHTHRISMPEDVPRQVQRVQEFALLLHSFDTLRGTVLRYEFCTRGPQVEKAARLTLVGIPASLRQYREALAYALGWMESKLDDTDADGLRRTL
jgi:hypothetical protein